MDDQYIEDFFIVNRWILQCAGLWSPSNKKQFTLIFYKMYSIVMFLFVILFFTATECVSLIYTFKNEYELIKNISFALTHLMGAIKVIFFYCQGHKLLMIMDILESKEFRYRSSAEHNFFPGLISKRYKSIGIKYSILFLLLAHATLMSAFLPPTITALSLIYKKQYPEQHNSFKLPVYCWIPFEYNTSGYYLIALGYQAVPLLSYAYSIVGMDTLFMNIMNCIGYNLTVIQGAFLTMRNRATKFVKGSITDFNGCDSEELKLVMGTEMKKICRHLQTVYKVCEELENIHKYLTLAQVTATLFILCSCLYLVSSTPVNSKQFYAEIIYMAAMGFQLVLYCWFGNEVTLKASNLPFYIWQSDWITSSKDLKMCMVLTMARAKKPLYLTAGNFAPLTLTTFVSIIKGSYSFFTVIKSTND